MHGVYSILSSSVQVIVERTMVLRWVLQLRERIQHEPKKHFDPACIMPSDDMPQRTPQPAVAAAIMIMKPVGSTMSFELSHEVMKPKLTMGGFNSSMCNLYMLFLLSFIVSPGHLS